MTTDRPPPHSPLLALAKTAFLWVGLPVGAVAAVLYGMAVYKTPSERFADRYNAETKAKLDVTMKANRAATELQLQRAANHPDAKRLETELSKLTPEQRAKRVGELMEEYAKKVRSGQQ